MTSTASPQSHFQRQSWSLVKKLLVKRKQPFILKIEFLKFCYLGKMRHYPMIMKWFNPDFEITEWKNIVVTMAALRFHTFALKLHSFSYDHGRQRSCLPFIHSWYFKLAFMELRIHLQQIWHACMIITMSLVISASYYTDDWWLSSSVLINWAIISYAEYGAAAGMTSVYCNDTKKL